MSIRKGAHWQTKVTRAEDAADIRSDLRHAFPGDAVILPSLEKMSANDLGSLAYYISELVRRSA